MSVTCNRSVVFSGYFRVLHQWNWPPWYNWNIVDSGVIHECSAWVITLVVWYGRFIFWYKVCKSTCSYIYYIDLKLLFALIKHLKKEHVFHCRMLNDVFDCDDDVCTVRKPGEIQVNIRLHNTSYHTQWSAIIV